MESKFTGKLIGLIGMHLLSFLIVLVTLGLAYPAAVCMQERWYARHTYIDGKQLVFDGNGWQLFGKYIVWFLLSIITLGIYGFWVGIKMKKWVVAHTHFAEEKKAD